MAYIPRSQELNQKIALKNIATPVSNHGVATETTTVMTAWARITELGGTVETTEMQEQIMRRQYEIWTRYDSAITAWTQIEWGARTLVITAPPQKVTDINNRQWMVIQAVETTERDLSS